MDQTTVPRGELLDLLHTRRDAWQAEKYILSQGRVDFWMFRKTINPTMLRAWWQRDVAYHLQQFYLDLKAGLRPKIVLEAPPQHGKSEQVRDFICWLAGRNPDLKQIFTSFSDELGQTTNLAVQRKMMSPAYRAMFFKTRLPTVEASAQDRWRRTTNIIEFRGHKGSFRNTTVAGQINGQGLDVGIIDDPMKGREAASSKQQRDKTWNWLTDDFFPRFSKDAGMILIATRWSLDDPSGRWLEAFPDTKVLRYSAVADDDDWSVAAGYRQAGEALFPEHKPLDFLLERKQLMTQASWLSEYQQTPIAAGGSMFPLDKISVLPARPTMRDVSKAARYWDKAGTSGGGAYTAGVLLLRMRDDTFVVADVRRGQWSALDRERVIKQTAAADRELYPITKIYVEQEPGSGGKESAENTVRMLAGYTVEADRVSGSKEVRADPFAAQWQAGNVRIVAGDWNRAYLDEAETWPAGKYLDQIDASSGAFNKLVSKYRYDASLSWVS